MARKFSVSEVVDLVCEDFSESKREEGGEDVYSYRDVLFFGLVNFESLAIAVTFSIGDNCSDFCSGSDQNAEESKDTAACTEKGMEADVPGKNI